MKENTAPIRHIGSGESQVDLSPKDHVNVLATETFKAAINGIDVVTFIAGQVYARPFQRKEVAVYLEDGRLELADKPKKHEAVEEAEPKGKADKKVEPKGKK